MKHAMILAAAMALTCSAWAATYDIVGSGSAAYYDVNVAYRLGADGQAMASVVGLRAEGVNLQQGRPESIIDGNLQHWGVTGADDDTRWMQMDITLDRVYTLNTFLLEFAEYGAGATYEIRVSDDGIHWTTAVDRTAITGSRFFTSFDAVDVQYIQYQVWGPGGQGSYGVLYPVELSAYVAASATTNIPQRDEGYNIMKGAALVESYKMSDIAAAVDGYVGSWASPGGTADDMSWAVWDIGHDAWLTAVQVSMYAGWDFLQVSISMDGVTWSELRTPKDADGAGRTLWLLGGDTIVLDAPTEARYIKIEGYAGGYNGHFSELMAFATIPEPATMTLLALGGLALLRRRK